MRYDVNADTQLREPAQTAGVGEGGGCQPGLAERGVRRAHLGVPAVVQPTLSLLCPLGVLSPLILGVWGLCSGRPLAVPEDTAKCWQGMGAATCGETQALCSPLDVL